MLILIFKNTRAVIQSERTLREARISFQVIPTPRHISSECGMCLTVDKKEVEKAKDVLNANQLEVVKIYES